jgi:alpha-L-fucosidase 2
MFMTRLHLLLFLCFCLSFLACKPKMEPDAINPSVMLWYDKPATIWNEALPLGNGRMGAMVYGKTESEIIQFNEETLWTGQPHDYARKGAHEYLDELRRLLWDGKQGEAHELGNRHFMSQPFGQLSYQPFGNILLSFPGHENVDNYHRRLNLQDAISSVFYEVNGVQFKREVFSSYPDQAIVVRLESSKNGALNFTAGLDAPHSDYEVSVDGDQIILKGKANDYPKELDRVGKPYPKSELTFEARLKVEQQGGGLVQNDNAIEVVNARHATLYLVAATSFVNYNDISANPAQRCDDYLTNLEGKSFKALKERHTDDYQELFSRVDLDLGASEISLRPTSQRLVSFYEDEDPSLVSLLFQYGRYLLIASSRPGTQPANLQGIWNDRLAPMWDSKYTININTEMNYWPAEMTNLAECAEPLFSMVEDLAVTGQNVAREHYNLNGWVTHHNTDLWRGAAPINNSNHGIWPTGGAWLSQHLWWHYQYNGDIDFLRNRAWPVLKEASRFFADYLVPWPENPEWLVSGPSNSPELGGMVMGPTMDHQIIRDLFANTIETSEILGIDREFAEMLKEKRRKIAPNQIGQHGQLQEWLEDKDNPNEKHRHVSHLWGLHPGDEIHPLTTQDLAEACKVTLAHRGDGGSGWAQAWKINLWARLLNGDHTYSLLKNLVVPSKVFDRYAGNEGGIYMNMLCACPPFQIDGNFGATSGITEMLLQSHLRDDNGDFYQDILPALPGKLSSGKISGIKGRGGFEFSIHWENGELTALQARSILGNVLNVRYRGKFLSMETSKGEIVQLGKEDFK